MHNLKKATELMENRLNLKVKPLLIRSYFVSEAIINLTSTQKYSLIVLGASNEGLLKNAITGNIPQAIARDANSTVIIFRSSFET